MHDDKVTYALRRLLEIIGHGETEERAGELRSLLGAIEPLLRAVDQIRNMHVDKQVEVGQPYPGRRQGVEPLSFLIEQYGAEIRSGRLGPGRLNKLDKRLFSAVKDRLAHLEGSPSVRTFMEAQMSPNDAGLSPYQQRVRACAVILGSSEDVAAAFFGTLRPGRIKEAGTLYRRASAIDGRD